MTTISPQFECHQCGLCCRTKYLCLYPAELKRAIIYAKKLQFKLPVEPLRTIIEAKSQKIIVLIYRVTTRPCPFFLDNKCLIQDEKFIACKKYPISNWVDLGNIFRKFGFKSEFYDVDENCSFIRTHSLFLSLIKSQSLKSLFPREFFATQADKTMWFDLDSKFRSLHKKQKIKILNENRLKRTNPGMLDTVIHTWQHISADDFLKSISEAEP